jgi:hypothetical protein
MDRSAFLNALPFLIPHSSHHWPPAVPYQFCFLSKDTKNKVDDTRNQSPSSGLMDHRDRYQLSIEIVQQQQQQEEDSSCQNEEEGNETEVNNHPRKKICRPCFFGKLSSSSTTTTTTTTTTMEKTTTSSRRTGFDPAVSDLQIALVGSNISNGTTTTTSYTTVGWNLFIRVDNEHVYGVDWNQLQNLHWDPETYMKDHGDNRCTNKMDHDKDNDDDDVYESYQQRRKRMRPASLVLEFLTTQQAVVAFRIYDPDGNHPETLERVRNTLINIRQTHATCTAPLQPSPSSTSSTHCNIAGTEAAASSSSTTTTTTISSPDLLAKHPNQTLDNAAAAPPSPPQKIIQPKHRFEALRDTNSTLETIHQILQTPVSAFAGTTASTTSTLAAMNSTNEAAELDSKTPSLLLLPPPTDTHLSLGPLLTRMGSLQSSAYMTHAERMAMETQYEQQIQENEQRIEETLNVFFQRQKQQQQQHRCPSQKNSKTKTPETPSIQKVVVENPQEQYQQLMDQQRQITEERYKHFLLPTRG